MRIATYAVMRNVFHGVVLSTEPEEVRSQRTRGRSPQSPASNEAQQQISAVWNNSEHDNKSSNTGSNWFKCRFLFERVLDEFFWSSLTVVPYEESGSIHLCHVILLG
jgi:hypothetical protein